MNLSACIVVYNGYDEVLKAALDRLDGWREKMAR